MKARQKLYLSLYMNFPSKSFSLRVISKSIIQRKFSRVYPLRNLAKIFYTSDLAHFGHTGVIGGAEHEKDLSFTIQAHLKADSFSRPQKLPC